MDNSLDFVVMGDIYDYPDWAIRSGEWIRTSLVVAIGYNEEGDAVRVETENSRYDLGKPYKVTMKPKDLKDGS